MWLLTTTIIPGTETFNSNLVAHPVLTLEGSDIVNGVVGGGRKSLF